MRWWRWRSGSTGRNCGRRWRWTDVTSASGVECFAELIWVWGWVWGWVGGVGGELEVGGDFGDEFFAYAGDLVEVFGGVEENGGRGVGGGVGVAPVEDS